jgi:hypothetical protein
MGRAGNDIDSITKEPETIHIGRANPTDHPGGVRVVRELGLDYLRSKLIEHFDILFAKGEEVGTRVEVVQQRR